MIAAVLVAIYAQVGQDTIGQIESFFAERPELAELHRGYLEFLDSGSFPAEAEQSFNNLLASPGFHDLITAFDEEMVANPELEEAFYRYYRHLAKDPSARRAVESIRRVIRQEGSHREIVEPAIRYMKAHPAEAREFLQGPRPLTSGEDELRAMRGLLDRDDALRRQLFEAFDTIVNDASAMRALTPYWQQAADLEAAAAVEEYLAERPGFGSIFDRRNLLLAEKPKLRMWTNYWRRLVRRNPELAPMYAEYLEELSEEPDRRKALLTRWAAERGNVDWPPDREPPHLSPLRGAARIQVDKPVVERPEKPEVPRPEVKRPIPPQRPLGPERPEKPELRERELKPER